MSITNGSKGNATAGRHETPYDFPEWINFTKGMTSAVSALSDRDFGTELCGMISEDENFSPEDPPERLTNYVIAKTIAIVKERGFAVTLCASYSASFCGLKKLGRRLTRPPF